MRTLSIGLFTYSTQPRGSVVHAACLADALCARGHDVTLYALDKSGDGFFRSLACALSRVPAAPAPSLIDLLVAQRIRELSDFLALTRPRHDVFHAQDCLVASGLFAARPVLGAGLVVRTVHHVEAFESPYLEQCQARSVRESDLCLSVSEKTRGEVLAHYARDAPDVGNGVDFERFANAKPACGDSLRASLGVPFSAPLVLSVGGVEPRKNTLNMLEAFALAKRARPDLRWIIAGGASLFEHASYRAAFEARLSTLDLATQAAIVRLGVVNEAELPRLFSAAQVFLHASSLEGFGLSVLEAMAASVPVVVSRGAPFDEYLDDGAALRVSPSDPEDIARGLLAALHGQHGRVREARERARRYSWRRCADAHETHYLRALSMRAASA